MWMWMSSIEIPVGLMWVEGTKNNVMRRYHHLDMLRVRYLNQAEGMENDIIN
jgi:hypothetical protein